MVHAFLTLAAAEAEKSETIFFIAGCVFAAWAVIVGSLGLRSESFGNTKSLSRAIIGVSVLLAGATMAAILYVSN